jgi:glucokinase
VNAGQVVSKMDNRMDIVAGIDLGGTDTKFGLVNKKGDLLAYHSIPTDPRIGYQPFFELLGREIEQLMLSVGDGYHLAGVSVGAPSGNQKNGTIDSASNLKWPERLPVADILNSIFGLPVTVSNDANAAALGEMYYGLGKGVQDLICITLGTGLGSGIISGGRLLTGSNGHAGELGHVIAVENGRQCTCGRKGCLETYVSATGMVRSVMETEPDVLKRSLLGKPNRHNLTSKKITSAAIEGDELALEVFDATAKIFGKTLANSVALLNPELIVLTGGLAKAGKYLLDPTIRYLNQYLLDMYKGSVEIKISEMNNKKTAILGAAAFMWLRLEEISQTTLQ